MSFLDEVSYDRKNNKGIVFHANDGLRASDFFSSYC